MGRVTSKYIGFGDGDEEDKTRFHPAPLPYLDMGFVEKLCCQGMPTSANETTLVSLEISDLALVKVLQPFFFSLTMILAIMDLVI
jgi:hypothetical protein